MDSVWSQLALVAVLVIINAAFAGTEMALVSLRDAQINRLAERGVAGRTLAKLAREPNQFLATIQIGITLAGLLASATAAVTLAEPLVELLAPLGGLARPLSVITVTVLLTFVTLVFGELAPKRLAMQRAERWALVTARPLAMLSTLSRPAVWLLGHATDLIVRLLGGDPDQTRDEVTEAELRDMVAVQPELSDQERAIIDGAFELADRPVRRVLVPRLRVVAVHRDAKVDEAVETMTFTGHSRIPVHDGSLDHVVGIVHLRDLVRADGVVADHMSDPMLLPETVTVLDALRTMQEQRQQMAIVIDEYGGAEGIITVEDLVEELVGEIYDEFDPDVRAVQRQADGSFVVVGSYPVHDLIDLGVDVHVGPYATVAGLILHDLGHLPVPGDRVDVDGWRFEVVEATARVIDLVHIAVLPVNEPELDQPTQ